MTLEAFSRLLIDQALTDSGWNLFDNSQVREVRALEESQAERRGKLDALFDSLLQRAFRGEL